METAWQLELPRAGVAVQADATTEMLFVQRACRVDLTGVRAALNGYQRGRCFYCRAETPLAAADVDHFFQWVLKERGAVPEQNGSAAPARRCA